MAAPRSAPPAPVNSTVASLDLDPLRVIGWASSNSDDLAQIIATDYLMGEVRDASVLAIAAVLREGNPGLARLISAHADLFGPALVGIANQALLQAAPDAPVDPRTAMVADLARAVVSVADNTGPLVGLLNSPGVSLLARRVVAVRLLADTGLDEHRFVGLREIARILLAPRNAG